MDTVIKVENLSKQYRLGEVGTGTLKSDLTRWWAKMRGKEDPFLKIGETNDRTSKGNSEYVWALKDLNFEIKQGDVVGIIGRNGAGKSTLLKILSKTTLPTTGAIKIKGRIASLLEVGTGFHPDLSGRDNIFLNGAILGMKKREIQSKFDEIVAFAGVERYIDTPVKRYSSGMYVRLAFAVAAHLDPEILIVDEVLAVGDAEFQKKAIGKMKSVSEEGGRTVLFVSHNMGAVKSLCTNGIYMKNGTLEYMGRIDQTIQKYYSSNQEKNNLPLSQRIERLGTGDMIFTDIKMYGLKHEERSEFEQGESIIIRLYYKVMKPTLDYSGTHFSVSVFDNERKLIFGHSNRENGIVFKDQQIKSKEYIEFYLNDICLTPGDYNVNINIVNGGTFVDYIENATLLNISAGLLFKNTLSTGQGIINVNGFWKI